VIVVLSDGDDNNSDEIINPRAAEATATANASVNASGERAGQPAQAAQTAAQAALQRAHERAVVNVQKAVQQADVIFYSVNPGGPSIKLNRIAMRAERGMEAIAETTGGTAFVPDSDADLERVFRQVAAELRGQYLLQYYGNSEAPPNVFRKIQVAVPTRGDVRVRARQGYYPKKSD
jgi:VWFA-related protein